MLWWTLRRVRTGSDRRREEAAARLAQYRDPRVIPALIEVCFHDWDTAVRTAAANALLRIDDPKVVELLVTSLVEHSFYVDKVPKLAYQTIIRDERGVSLLASELRRKWTVESGGPDFRLIAAVMEDELVAAIGYPLVTHLGEMLRTDPHDRVRRFAAEAMTFSLPSYRRPAQSMLVDTVVKHLAHALNDPDGRVREAAETGLLHFHTPSAVSNLAEQLLTKRGERLKVAVENLNRADQSWAKSEAASGVLPLLVQGLKEQEGDDLELAIAALDLMNPAWVESSEAEAVAPHLRAQIDSERRQLGRRGVIASLVRIYRSNGIEVFIAILDPSRPTVVFSEEFWARRWGNEADRRKEDSCVAMQTLNESQPNWVKSPRATEVVNWIISALEERGNWTNESFEEAAIEVLGMLGDMRAVPALLNKLQDEDDSLPSGRRVRSRAVAARVLGRLRAWEAAPYLVRALSVEGGIELAAVNALREIGWPKAAMGPDALCCIAKGDFKGSALAGGPDWLPGAVSTARGELYVRCLTAERFRGIAAEAATQLILDLCETFPDLLGREDLSGVGLFFRERLNDLSVDAGIPMELIGLVRTALSRSRESTTAVRELCNEAHFFATLALSRLAMKKEAVVDIGSDCVNYVTLHFLEEKTIATEELKRRGA